MDEQSNTQAQAPAPAPEHQGMGPMIGAAIILGLILVGGVYFYGLQLQKQEREEALPLILGDEPAPAPVPSLENTPAVPGMSDAELEQLEADIEADLNALESAL